MTQPNPILQSNLPGLAIGDWQDTSAKPTPSPYVGPLPPPVLGTVKAKDYGVKGDGVFLYNATMVAGSPVLNSADPGVNFTRADVGKSILVSGVAAGNDALVTTIVSVQSPSRCTLATPATVNSPDPAGFQIAVYGTDDTVAFQAASDAAAASGSGTLELDNRVYVLAGALQQGGARKANSQITLPNNGNPGGLGRLVWRGARDATGNPYMPFPTATGTVIVSMLVGQAYSPTYGIPSVIGGPTVEQQNTGSNQQRFSNWFVGFESLTVITPRNPSLSAFNLEGCSSHNHYKVVAGTLEWGYPTNAFDSLAIALPSNPQACAFIHPRTGNAQAGSAAGDQIFAWGYFAGIAPNEHTFVSTAMLQFCRIPVAVRSGYTHQARFSYLGVQGSPYVVSGWDPTQALAANAIVAVPAPQNTAGNGLLIDALDLEDYSDNNLVANGQVLVNHVNDPNNMLNATIRGFTRWSYVTGVYTSKQQLLLNGGSGVQTTPLGATVTPWVQTITPILGEQDAANKVGTWAGFISAANVADLVYNSTNAQNDEIDWDLSLEAGTYTLALAYPIGPAQAILTVTLDGVPVGTIDQYNAATVYWNRGKIQGITVPNTGKHRLGFKAATRNGASTGWTIELQRIQLRRTA
jgi:hypothetical protein